MKKHPPCRWGRFGYQSPVQLADLNHLRRDLLVPGGHVQQSDQKGLPGDRGGADPGGGCDLLDLLRSPRPGHRRYPSVSGRFLERQNSQVRTTAARRKSKPRCGRSRYRLLPYPAAGSFFRRTIRKYSTPKAIHPIKTPIAHGFSRDKAMSQVGTVARMARTGTAGYPQSL